MRRVICAFTLLFLLLIPSAGQADDRLDLHLTFKKGEVHRMRVTLEQTIDQTLDGAAQQTHQTIVLGYAFTIDDLDAQGVATISVRYDAASLHAKTMEGAVDYDSSHPSPQVPAMAAGLAALVGQGYSLKVTGDGHVTNVTGLDKMLAAVLTKMNIPPGPIRTAAENGVRQQLNAENLKATLQGLFAPFPGHPIVTGETWARDAQITLGFPLLIESGFRLKGRQDGIATIELLGKVSTAPNAVIDLGPQMRMSYQLRGDQHGTIQVDESTGWTRSAQSVQKLTGSATIETHGAPPRPVPVTIESQTTMEAL